MRSLKTQGIIIKRINLGEADRIVTVFTKTEGKIQIKAKGVRRINSRRASHVELLNLSTLSIYNSTKSLILIEAETLNSFLNIKNNLQKVGYAYHICELVNGLCAEREGNENIYRLILESLQRLENEDGARVVKDFERKLLIGLGFWPKEKYFEEDRSQFIIENILEKRLKTIRLLPLFAESF